MDMTQAETELRRLLFDVVAALDARNYESAERWLTKALLDTRSLRLLGPEGARGIPVDDIRWMNERGVMRGLDSPAGAGADVEAERG